METGLQKVEPRLPVVATALWVAPRNLDEVMTFADLVAKSGLAPKSFDSPSKIAYGILMCLELGRPVITGLQDLAVVNGHCRIYGDAVIAQVLASGQMEEGYPKEEEVGTPYMDAWTFRYTVKRRGRPPKTGTWTWVDSKRAGYDKPKTRDGKDDIWSPWTKYPRRMMQWKARNFVLRDEFGDILRGMKTVEEAYDLVDMDQTPNGAWVPPTKPVPEGEPVPTPQAVEPDIETRFRNEVLEPSGISYDHMMRFVMASGEHFKLAVEQVQGEALNGPKKFIATAKAWVKKHAKELEGDPVPCEPEEQGPVEVPTAPPFIAKMEGYRQALPAPSYNRVLMVAGFKSAEEVDEAHQAIILERMGSELDAVNEKVRQ